VETGDNRPTDAASEIFRVLSVDLQAQLDALAGIERTDLAAFNRILRSAKLPAVAAKPVGRAR
jgi:hypothetical protein